MNEEVDNTDKFYGIFEAIKEGAVSKETIDLFNTFSVEDKIRLQCYLREKYRTTPGIDKSKGYNVIL